MAYSVECISGGHKYRARRLRPDLHVLLFARLMPLAKKAAGPTRSGETDAARMWACLRTIPVEDWQLVVNNVFPLIERETQGGNWAPIFDSETGSLLFDDIGVADMMELLGAVMMGSLIEPQESTSDRPATPDGPASPHMN